MFSDSGLFQLFPHRFNCLWMKFLHCRIWRIGPCYRVFWKKKWIAIFEFRWTSIRIVPRLAQFSPRLTKLRSKRDRLTERDQSNSCVGLNRRWTNQQVCLEEQTRSDKHELFSSRLLISITEDLAALVSSLTRYNYIRNKIRSRVTPSWPAANFRNFLREFTDNSSPETWREFMTEY